MNRLLSLLTTIALLINTLSILAVPVSAATVSDFVYQNYSVKYTVKSEKVQTKTIEITLKNTGKEAMYSWALGFDATGKISDLKGAEIYGNEETSYILRNTEKNFELAAGKSVVISYTLTGAKLATPKVFELMSYRVFAEEGFEAKLHRDDKKIETFEGGVTVTNTGETPIEAWALSFDANFEITKLASGKILNFEDKRYTISNTNRQKAIAPGESFEIAFSAKNSAGVTPKIENVTLTKVEITAKEYANVPQIEAWTEYEEGTLTLKWESSLPVGKFTLYESADDKTYTKRIELKNKFEYVYKYAFEKRYFKIVQTRDGITSESIAFVVEKTTDPVTGEVTFVSARPDADGDGLENYIEDILGTDREKADTDNDGLTDYEEVYLSGSDPLKYDSIKAGVSDANADADEDGLNTRREIQLGTNPLDEDSDYDGLDDGAEVNTHHTNPLKSDTDGDFIPDGDELALGLNPNSGATNGIPDNQRTTAQTIGKNSESLQYINSKSDTKFSLQITAAGLAENSISSGESGYAAVMNNPAIIGAIPVFSYTEGLTVSEVTISAEIGASNLANTVGTYAEINPEFEGIKRLNFFRYFEEINTLLPVETTFDVSKNMMYTKTDELGTYCIMDMEIWLDSLGGAELLEAVQAESEPETEPETEPEQQTMRAFSAANLTLQSKVDVLPLEATMAVSPVLPGEKEAAAESLANDDYDVIFLTDNSISNVGYINLASNYIKANGKNLTTVFIEDFYDQTEGLLNGKFDMSAEILKVLESENYNRNRKTHIILMVNHENIASRGLTSQKLNNKLGELSDKKPYISIVTNLTEYDEEKYFAEIKNITNGFTINTEPLLYNRVAVVRALLNHLNISITQIKFITSVDLVPLPQNFDSIYIQDVYNTGIGENSTDYDKDGLLDYYEIAFFSDLINFSNPEPFPTLERCASNQNLVCVEEGLSRFMDTHTPGPDLVYHLSQIPILPINSDPTKSDGDYDGISDVKEHNLYNDKVRLTLSNTQHVDYIQAKWKDDKEIFSYEQDFKMNFSWFYEKNAGNKIEFNDDLSLSSIIFAGLAYHTSEIDISGGKVSDYVSDSSKEYYYAMDGKNVYPKQKLPDIMREFGFNDVETVNLRNCTDTNNIYYTDNDLIQYDIGIRDISEYKPEGYTGSRDKLVSIFVRGTHGTEEWMSNFDIGNTDEWTGQDDWTTKANHKGFDVAATRALKEIKNYLSQNQINTSNSVIWLAGHSRGGAVSGIISAYLIDLGYTVYSYNFATPNQVENNRDVYTNTKMPSQYDGIYNIVNADDLVPQLPLESWGFTKYGETRPLMSFTLEDEQEWIIKGVETDNPIDFKEYQISTNPSVEDTIESFNKISNTRNGCYINDGNEEKELDLYKQGYISELTNDYPTLVDFYDLYDFIYKDEVYLLDQKQVITLHQKPILFMQILGIACSSDFKIQYRFLEKSYSSNFYVDQTDKMMLFAIKSGIMNPHFVDAYIILNE
jgi:hypothetical protein